MIDNVKQRFYSGLRASEKYVKTDMVHFVVSNFWLNIGRVVSIGVGMVFTVAFANLLSPEAFGTYKYVLAVAGTIGAFSLNTISGSLMRAIAQGKKHVIPGVVRAAILWSLPASAVALGISAYYFYQGNATLGYGFIFIAFANALNNGYGLSKSILVAVGDFKRNTIISIPRSLFPVVCVVGALFITHNVVWILLAYFASNIIGSYAQYLWSLRALQVEESNADVSDVIKYGKHLSILGFFVLVSGQIDQLLLWHYTGATALAVYALALTPIKEIRNLLDNILAIAFPKMAARTEEEIRRMMPLRIKQLFILSVLACAGYIALAPFLFTYLFPKYMSAILVTQIMSLSILFQWRGLIDTYIITHGAVKKRYVAILSSQAGEFALYLILIPFFGLWGAVAATVLSEGVAALALYLVYRKI